MIYRCERDVNAYSYEKISGSVLIPISFYDAIKNYLKIDPSVTVDDDLIISMTATAIEFIERYTSRTIFTTEFRTWRNEFPCGCNAYIELRRSPFQIVNSFQYIDTDNITQTIDASVYYTTQETDYSKILLNPSQSYPTDKICKLQSIIIEFTAGYGDTVDNIPPELLLAIYQIVAKLYDNRGDCADSTSARSCACADMLIKGTLKMLLDPYRIMRL